MTNKEKEINDEKYEYEHYGFTEECDCCHNIKPMLNYHRYNDEFVEYNGVQFLCKKCRE